MPSHLTFLHALSPLHAGTGQGVGVIDLPIARERASDLPYLPGSSLKGTLRDLCPEAQRAALFGPPQANAADHAGAVQFSDQRLLLLPVRSLAGTFAWVTAPYLLRRLARDAQDCGKQPPPALTAPAQLNACYAGAAITLGGTQVILEDLDLTAQSGGNLGVWATFIGKQVFPNAPDWQAMLAERICLVHDDVLSFLLSTATEVIARVSLREETKTVNDGGLWYEEALPAETILAGVALVGRSLVPNDTQSAADLLRTLKTLTNQTAQFGGKATVGRGLCRVQLGA